MLKALKTYLVVKCRNIANLTLFPNTSCGISSFLPFTNYKTRPLAIEHLGCNEWLQNVYITGVYFRFQIVLNE